MEQNPGSACIGHLRSDPGLQDGERRDPTRQDWENHQIYSGRHRGVYQRASNRRVKENFPARATNANANPACASQADCRESKNFYQITRQWFLPISLAWLPIFGRCWDESIPRVPPHPFPAFAPARRPSLHRSHV